VVSDQGESDGDCVRTGIRIGGREPPDPRRRNVLPLSWLEHVRQYGRLSKESVREESLDNCIHAVVPSELTAPSWLTIEAGVPSRDWSRRVPAAKRSYAHLSLSVIKCVTG
jgi:hypothetical protein